MKLFFILLLLLSPFSYGEVRLIEVEIPEGKDCRFSISDLSFGSPQIDFDHDMESYNLQFTF